MPTPQPTMVRVSRLPWRMAQAAPHIRTLEIKKAILRRWPGATAVPSRNVRSSGMSAAIRARFSIPCLQPAPLAQFQCLLDAGKNCFRRSYCSRIRDIVLHFSATGSAPWPGAGRTPPAQGHTRVSRYPPSLDRFLSNSFHVSGVILNQAARPATIFPSAGLTAVRPSFLEDHRLSVQLLKYAHSLFGYRAVCSGPVDKSTVLRIVRIISAERSSQPLHTGAMVGEK